jgi:hypothetical protein
MPQEPLNLSQYYALVVEHPRKCAPDIRESVPFRDQTRPSRGGAPYASLNLAHFRAGYPRPLPYIGGIGSVD